MNTADKQFKVDLEIYLIFVLLIGISVFNAIYSSVKIEKSQRITANIIAVETPSIESLGQLNELVVRSRMHITNWVYLPYSSEDKQSLKKLMNSDYPKIKNDIGLLMKKWIDVDNIPKLNWSFNKIENLLGEERKLSETLQSFSDYEDPMTKFAADEKIENVILPQAAAISNELNAIISTKQLHLENLHNEMQVSYRNLVWSVLGMAFVLILVVLFAAFYLSHFMIMPVMKLKGYIVQLRHGEIPSINMKAKKNAVGQMTAAIIALTESVHITTRFAYEIGEGKFDAAYKTLGENDELGNALIQMRDKLRRAQYELTEYTEQLQLQNDILLQARHDLFEKAKELELANKYKSEFLANMSHELRTPLNSILVLTKILGENRNSTLTEKEIQFASIIHKSGTGLLVLINDILDMSKIEAGRLDLHYEKIHIIDLKDELQMLFEEVAKEKKINFGIEMSTNLPENIVGDRLRLSQIIRNLLSNAFKFTDSTGEVILRFKTAAHSFEPMLEISVADTGIGIPAEKLQMIFEAFQQADGSTSRKYGGTGLGLSISKMLVDLMKGNIGVMSTPGQGSTFYINIPVNAHINPDEINKQDSVSERLISKPSGQKRL